MAEPTAEERKKELAEAIADGFDIFKAREDERKAKAEAADKDKGDKGDRNTGDADPPKSWAERLLG